jgi:hypothetical protein
VSWLAFPHKTTIKIKFCPLALYIQSRINQKLLLPYADFKALLVSSQTLKAIFFVSSVLNGSQFQFYFSINAEQRSVFIQIPLCSRLGFFFITFDVLSLNISRQIQTGLRTL